MEAYRRFSQQKLFLSLKRDLVMVSNSIHFSTYIFGYFYKFLLGQPESIYYNPEICKLPGPNSSHPEQATQASEQSMADQAPPTHLEVPKDSNQGGGQGKKTKDLKGMNKGQDKKKNSSDPKEKASDTVAT